MTAAASRGRMVVVSNRLPVRATRSTNGCCELAPASGGLVTALAPLMPLLFEPFAGTPFALPGGRDVALLLTLAFACTLLPFALSLVALRHMSAFAAQLAVNLEPLYAIAFAAVLLGEQREVTWLFYVAVAIILGAVFAHPLLNRQRRIDHPEFLATAEAKQSVD